jgi:hypothetical protein
MLKIKIKSMFAPKFAPHAFWKAKGRDLLISPSALECQIVWSRWTDSDRRPAVYKTAALPTELHRHSDIVTWGWPGSQSRNRAAWLNLSSDFRRIDSLPAAWYPYAV